MSFFLRFGVGIFTHLAFDLFAATFIRDGKANLNGVAAGAQKVLYRSAAEASQKYCSDKAAGYWTAVAMGAMIVDETSTVPDFARNPGSMTMTPNP